MKKIFIFLLLIFVSADNARKDPVVPDPKLTPGDTVRVSITELCQHGYTASVRDVPDSLKKQVFEEYGIDPSRSGEFEVDHLCSLEIGGSNDIKNLWPEKYDNVIHGFQMGAREKDKLENRLHKMVCDGDISLKQAQVEVCTDWPRAYRKYIGEFPREK